MTDLKAMACDILKSYWLEQIYADDQTSLDLAAQDPDGSELSDEDFDVLVENISRAKVNVVVTL